MKKVKLITVLIFIAILIGILLNIETTNLNKKACTIELAMSTTYTSKESSTKGTVYKANKLRKNTTKEEDIEYNTKYLQELVDAASKTGGGVVELPAGTYYFAPQAANSRKNEDYVIKARDNVLIEGKGIDESNQNKCTILKPYGKVEYSNYGGIDMFYYNEYHDLNKDNPVFVHDNKTTKYLENADFKNFIIDGEDTIAKNYNSSGKGFMFLMVKDCDYENIIVRNTEATGFGMDCPINCTIKKCIAINCGRSAKPTDVGASGFGIGTGYSNNESIIITDCKAYGNKKFGFFFEHQGRFCGTDYKRYPATKSKGFVVSNCVASGNMYDFGGARANDATYENCVSDYSYTNKNVENVASLYFEAMSRRIHVVNCSVEQKFTDVSNTSSYYYKPVYWALNNAITSGVTKTQFKPNKSTTRAEAVLLLWRLAERPGKVVYSTGDLLSSQFENIYADVAGDAFYVDAVKWAKDNKIITTKNKFSPNKDCTRAEFITMLWRYAGKPKVTTKSNFTDVPKGASYENAVNWAASKGILKGTSGTKFSPNKVCTRAEAVTFLYRYSNTKNTFSITFNLGGGTLNNAKKSYKAGKDAFTLGTPTRKGYTFLGWTGSNGEVPEKKVKITKNDRGNKTYTANWKPINYKIIFNANGGTGKMSTETFTYNVFQTLLTNKFTKANYTFTGWNTKANGTGKSYSNIQAVKNLSSKSNGKITLYAQWKKSSKITKQSNTTLKNLLNKIKGL